ncbi:secondary thiamine-phosphate synthase enzyme YjbQ [Methanobrevibacter curvatus]|nr:secondary thiamine-phosphate synthase enzyme YjbQ [Methanobrevibacter curvatus]
MIIQKKLNIKSKKKFEIIDISDEIKKIIKDSKINRGIVNIFSKHSTSAIVINENESGLLKDIEITLSKLVIENNDYYHDRIDNNGGSHLKAILLSPSETIPIYNCKLNLGTWQSIFFIEFDGPRNRIVDVTAIGD